jgi:hypothetical protein
MAATIMIQGICYDSATVRNDTCALIVTTVHQTPVVASTSDSLNQRANLATLTHRQQHANLGRNLYFC